MIMAMVVVLPAPLPPSRPVIEPSANRKRDAVDRRHPLVDLGQAVDFYGGLGGHEPQMWRVARDGGKSGAHGYSAVAGGWMRPPRQDRQKDGSGEASTHHENWTFRSRRSWRTAGSASFRRAALNSPAPPTRPASIACMSPSITRRRSIWCRCRASISPRSRARPSTMRLGPLVYLLAALSRRCG